MVMVGIMNETAKLFISWNIDSSIFNLEGGTTYF